MTELREAVTNSGSMMETTTAYRLPTPFQGDRKKLNINSSTFKGLNTMPVSSTSPAHNMTFNPKLVERSNIIRMTHLSKEEILERLEQERFQRLHKAASNLKADMMTSNRCPLCTLILPCKHFESQE